MSACRVAVCCCPTVADACCVLLGPLQEWFAALDDNTADALAFVVCVDSIGSGDGLYLHTSKKRTSVVAAPFFAAFERAAEVVGVDLVFNRKKVNLAAAPAWEHEVFARERIPALTVSALAQERPNMQRARLFDDRCVGVFVVVHSGDLTSMSWTAPAYRPRQCCETPKCSRRPSAP